MCSLLLDLRPRVEYKIVELKVRDAYRLDKIRIYSVLLSYDKTNSAARCRPPANQRAGVPGNFRGVCIDFVSWTNQVARWSGLN